MLNRKTLFSLFAVVAFAAAASFTVNSANAVPKGPGGFKGNVGKGGGGGAWPGGKGPGVIGPGKGGGGGKGPGVIGPGKGGGGGKGPGVVWPGKGPHFAKSHWCFKHSWRCRGHIHVVRYPVVRAVAIGGPVARTNCNCLTKTYLPSGAVLFKDVCTQEVAINPPEQQVQVR